MVSEHKTTLIDFNLTLKATKNNVEFLNYVYTVKGFKCHSNHSPQLFELKKQQLNNSCYLNHRYSLAK